MIDENLRTDIAMVSLTPMCPLASNKGCTLGNYTVLHSALCCIAGRSLLRPALASPAVKGTSFFLWIWTFDVYMRLTSLLQVSLMVFDECHHTRKNHAYNGIMREYLQWPPERRPKIFGMTASPIWNPKDAAESLATLERNLDAKVIAVREHVDELADHSPKPQEVGI